LTAASSSRSFLLRTSSKKDPPPEGWLTYSVHGKCSHTSVDCCTVKAHKKDKDRNCKDRNSKGKSKVQSHSVNNDTDSSASSDVSAHAHHVVVGERVMNNLRIYSAHESTSQRTSCIADTGATSHIVPHFSWFDAATYRALDALCMVHLGDETYVEALGIGKGRLVCKVGHRTNTITLTDVLYVPSFTIALISVHCLCQGGIRARLSDKMCCFCLDSATVMNGYHRRNLYHIHVSLTIYLPPPELANAAIDISILHWRMRHHNIPCLQRMVRNGKLENIDKLTGEPKFCESCTSAKMQKVLLPAETHTSVRKPLQIVHSDVGGLVNVQLHRSY
jgi:hypothetical protein